MLNNPLSPPPPSTHPLILWAAGLRPSRCTAYVPLGSPFEARCYRALPLFATTSLSPTHPLVLPRYSCPARAFFFLPHTAIYSAHPSSLSLFVSFTPSPPLSLSLAIPSQPPNHPPPVLYTCQMVSHFQRNGTPLLAIHEYPTLQDEADRFLRLGWGSVQASGRGWSRVVEGGRESGRGWSRVFGWTRGCVDVVESVRGCLSRRASGRVAALASEHVDEQASG